MKQKEIIIGQIFSARGAILGLLFILTVFLTPSHKAQALVGVNLTLTPTSVTAGQTITVNNGGRFEASNVGDACQNINPDQTHDRNLEMFIKNPSLRFDITDASNNLRASGRVLVPLVDYTQTVNGHSVNCGDSYLAQATPYSYQLTQNITYDTTPLAPGEYYMSFTDVEQSPPDCGTLDSTGQNQVGCPVPDTPSDAAFHFTVNGPPPCTVRVNSNMPTNWSVNGPTPNSGIGSTSATYGGSTPGSYSLTADDIPGYTKSINPGSGNCPSGGSLTFTITYSSNNPPPPSPGAPTCSPANQTITQGASASFAASSGDGSNYSWSASGGSPSSGSGAVFNSTYNSVGSYTVTVTSQGLNGTCNVQVNGAPPQAGSIRVVSNLSSSWTISGPNNFGGSGTDVTYPGQPAGTYTISNVPVIGGYNAPTVSPSSVQSLSGSNSIVYTINYSPNSPPSCTEDAQLSWIQTIPAIARAGTTYPLQIQASNTGDTWYYNGTYVFFQTEGPSTSAAISYYQGSSVYAHETMTGFNGGPALGTGIMGFARPGEAGNAFYNFTVPNTPGATYTLSFHMIHVNVNSSGPDYAHLASDDSPCGAPIPGPQGNSRSFGNELLVTFTVTNAATLTVNCPTPPPSTGSGWHLDKMDGTNYSGTHTYSLPADIYNVIWLPATGYVTPSPTSVTLGPNDNQTVTCSYPLKTLAAPSIESTDNSVCNTTSLVYYDNSAASGTTVQSDGMRVYRATSQGGAKTLIANLPSESGLGAQAFYDPGNINVGGVPALAANSTYYYTIQAYSNNPALTANSLEQGILVLSCAANLGNSSKTLLSAQKGGSGAFVAYDPNNPSTLNDGDVLRFRITIVNSGSASATINYIDDTPTNNLKNLTNLRVDKNGNGVYNEAGETASFAGNRITISGSKSVGNPNWVVEFDATLQAQTTNLDEFFKNTGDINYTDSAGNHDKIVIFGPVLFKKTGSKVPTFKEVSP